MEEDAAFLVTTDYILDETYTLLRMALGHATAVRFGNEASKGELTVVQFDASIQEEAWEVFERCGDKDFSFTDCTSFVVMRRGKIKVAFTFDRHFQQYGFQALPSKLVRGRK